MGSSIRPGRVGSRGPGSQAPVGLCLGELLSAPGPWSRAKQLPEREALWCGWAVPESAIPQLHCPEATPTSTLSRAWEGQVLPSPSPQ